ACAGCQRCASGSEGPFRRHHAMTLACCAKRDRVESRFVTPGCKAGRQITIQIKGLGRLDRGTSGAFVAAMTFRTTLAAVLLLAAGTAAAQPAPAPAPGLKAGDDEVEYAKEIDSLFVNGGLTSDQAAKRAPGASPAVLRAAAELAASAAQLEAAEYAQV